MGILKRRKNKKFSYSPRYYNNEGKGSPYQLEHKFDKFRSTAGDAGGLIHRFKSAWSEFRDESDRKTNRRVLWIVLILVFIFLFIIDFDLSIFFS